MMSVTAHASLDGNEVTVRVQGRFDFGVHKEFREATQEAKGPGTRFVVDLAGTEYMDSSALGMLLLLREQAGGDQSDIRISNPSPEVKKILTISNFQKMFKIL
jgi:anti-anti-sigma factor